MDSPIQKCRYCGSEALVFVPCPSSPGQNRIVCRACDRQLGLTPRPMTPERAAAFTMPFGKHENETIATIFETDPGYVRWLATDAGPGKSIQRAALAFLAFKEPHP